MLAVKIDVGEVLAEGIIAVRRLSLGSRAANELLFNLSIRH